MQNCLSPVMENYLEAIYVLTREHAAARVGDIARMAGVHKSTATAALRSLAGRQLVEYEAYKPVKLTPMGKRVGSEIRRRHDALLGFLVDVLGIPDDVAAQTACNMEHVMPLTVISRFAAFAEYVRHCPHAVARFVEGRGYACDEGTKGCTRCVDSDAPGKRQTKAGSLHGKSTHS